MKYPRLFIFCSIIVLLSLSRSMMGQCCNRHPVSDMISDAAMWSSKGYDAKHVYEDHTDMIKFTANSIAAFERMHKAVDDYYRIMKPCWQVGSVGHDYVSVTYQFNCGRDERIDR